MANPQDPTQGLTPIGTARLDDLPSSLLADTGACTSSRGVAFFSLRMAGTLNQ